MTPNPANAIANRRGAARHPTPARSAAVGKTSTSTPAWRRVSTAAATSPTSSSWSRGRRRDERPRRDPADEDEQRVEDRLRHQEAAVGERGERERERRHEHGGAPRDDRARPQVSRHRRERHADRPERLGDLVAAVRREPGERPADQRGVDEAVEVAVRVLDRQPAAVVERPPDRCRRSSRRARSTASGCRARAGCARESTRRRGRPTTSPARPPRERPPLSSPSTTGNLLRGAGRSAAGLDRRPREA